MFQRCSCLQQQHGRPVPWPSQLRGLRAFTPVRQQYKRANAAAGRRRLSVRANYDNMSTDLLGPHFHNRARISDEVMNKLMELPGTRGLGELRARAEDLTTWKMALQKGVLPHPEDVDWPVEPFKTKFMDALRALEMPRFTRRYPAILETLMKQMLNMVHDFETKLLEAESKRQQQQQRPPPMQQQQQSPQGQEQQQQQEEQDGEAGEEGQAGGMMEQQMEDLTQEQLEQALKDSMNQQGQSGEGSKQIQIMLQDMEGQQGGKTGDGGQEVDEALQQELESAAEQIVAEFQQGMQEVMDNLEKAQMAFDDLSELLEGEEGFALSQGTWQRDGWRELDDLRKKLEGLKELRELVRGLGRSGGKGPLRKAPEQVETPKHPVGVVRSPLQPEEVRGLTRGGELSRMLPSEMALLAHGWPRKVADNPEGAAAAAAAGGTVVSLSSVGSHDEEGQIIEEQYYLPGAHAARMLHRVRRAERMLLSYERCGWLDDTPSRLTGRQEIRPAAEMGPIILCLDTSGSMRGAREVVAKALALECMRGAHRQQRPCYLYAFSGPEQVQELELSVDLRSLDKLLDFLSCSFMGGTDVDRPLQLSLERLQKDEWQQADILMVTDGEIAPPKQELLDDIAKAHEEMGLEVHGLIVSSQLSESMQKLCTHLHVFKSWSKVGAESWQY